MQFGKPVRGVIAAIPAYNPPEALYAVVRGILTLDPEFPVLVCNDGSSPAFSPLFDRIRSDFPDVMFLEHDVNIGKGRALKDMIRFVQCKFPGSGIVFADGDGQHLPEDILKIAGCLKSGQSDLILGVRDFSGPEIPVRSRFGNKLTRFLFKHLTGMEISDTQTGLRGVSPSIMPELLELRGERYEFETEMLLAAWKHRWNTVQIPVATVYSNRRGASHFNPLADSVKIYAKLLKSVFSRRRKE